MYPPLLVPYSGNLAEFFRREVTDNIRQKGAEWAKRVGVLDATAPDLIAPADWADRLAFALESCTGTPYQRTDKLSRRFVKHVTRSIDKMGEAVVAMINDYKAMALESFASMATAVH
jgi:hypothetical protein